MTLPEDNKEDLCDCDLFKLICFMSKVFLILFNKFISITTFGYIGFIGELLD